MANASKNLEKIQKRFLAYLFNNKRFISGSIGRIKPTHLPEYTFIYELLLGYYNKFKDVITDEVVDIMFAKKNIKPDEIIRYKSIIGEIRAIKINNDAEFNSLISELEEAQKRKDYVAIAENIVNFNPVECSPEKLEEMEKKVKEDISKINSRTGEVRKEGLIKDSANDRLATYKHIKANPNSIAVVPTGFKKIDDENGGFRPGELIYVIGRKGDGKSVLLLNLAHNMWLAGFNVIIFTLEISKEDYERRFDSRAAGVPSSKLKMGKFDDIEEQIYENYIVNIAKGLGPDGQNVGNLFIVDCPGAITTAFMESKIDTIEQTHGIKFDVAASDYAGIMRSTMPGLEKRHEQGQIALDHKRLARERNLVVISAAQMSRAGKDQKETDSSAVAESDQIADHIDWGISIKSISETSGVISSFKTRDAAPVSFHFTKKYSQMKILELTDNLGSWDSLDGTS